jgi:HAE1 family hydrophobic/amphiphilic exporter-1
VTSTFLVTLFAPLFYVLIEKLFGKHRKLETTKTDSVNPSEDR